MTRHTVSLVVFVALASTLSFAGCFRSVNSGKLEKGKDKGQLKGEETNLVSVVGAQATTKKMHYTLTNGFIVLKQVYNPMQFNLV